MGKPPWVQMGKAAEAGQQTPVRRKELASPLLAALAERTARSTLLKLTKGAKAHSNLRPRFISDWRHQGQTASPSERKVMEITRMLQRLPTRRKCRFLRPSPSRLP